jgi:hypothetical protein
MFASSALSRLIRNGEAAIAAPAPAVTNSRRREIDLDFETLVVMASSPDVSG